MATVLNPDDMPDVVISILRNLNWGKWIGEMVDLQEHVGFNGMVKDKRETLSSGRGMKPRYIMDHNNSAENVGLFNEINYSRDDAMVEGDVPWRYTDAHMLYDEREEAMQGGKEMVVDHVKAENARMLTSLVSHCETKTWEAPSSSSDNKDQFGVKYWITRSATLGFNGGNHADFSSGKAGVSSSTYSRHKNFTGNYTDVTDSENTGLIWMMEQGADQTRWIPPAPEPGMGRKGYSKGIYCNWATKNALKNVTKDNNDSLGYDLSTKTPVFRGAPIMYTPYFDGDTTNPLYMIDHNHLYAMFQKGWFMKRIKVNRLPNQPHCFAVIVSMVWNIVADDIRRHAVFYE